MEIKWFRIGIDFCRAGEKQKGLVYACAENFVHIETVIGILKMDSLLQASQIQVGQSLDLSTMQT